MDSMTIALWQAPYAASPAEALAQLDTTAAQACAQGADLLLCPEMSLTGYAIGPERVAALAEPADGPLSKAVADIAQRHDLAIVFGYAERHPDAAQKPFNATQLIASDGMRVANYRKTHLFGEMDRVQFTAGDTAAQVFEWRGWRLGLLICYDVEFPEAVRGLALQGADVVLVPTANMVGFDEVPMLLVPARACENRIYVVYANASGSEHGMHYGGLSTAAGPGGQVLTRAGHDEVLLTLSLSRNELAQARRQGYLDQRRADLY